MLPPFNDRNFGAVQKACLHKVPLPLPSKLSMMVLCLGCHPTLSFLRILRPPPKQAAVERGAGVTTNSATATNCVSLYDLKGIH